MKKIFTYNILKWVRSQKKKKIILKLLLVTIFIEVGVDYFPKVFLKLKREKKFLEIFKVFLCLCGAIFSKNLAFNKQVNKSIFQAPKKSKTIQGTEEF